MPKKTTRKVARTPKAAKARRRTPLEVALLLAETKLGSIFSHAAIVIAAQRDGAYLDAKGKPLAKPIDVIPRKMPRDVAGWMRRLLQAQRYVLEGAERKLSEGTEPETLVDISGFAAMYALGGMTACAIADTPQSPPLLRVVRGGGASRTTKR
jgi:hypothetical protein